MKASKRMLFLALAAVTAISPLSACKKTSIVNDPKTINVKVFKGGFGTEWVYELKSKFEKVYEKEGYKINIVQPSEDMRGSVPIQDMVLGYETSKTDLYITGDIQSAQVGTYNTYKKGTALVEQTEELVFNQKAIGYDGQLEEKTVKAKLSDTMNEWLVDKTSYDSDGVYYGVPYINPIAGLVVNTKKLAKYGYTETPKTSDEIIEMATNIYLGCNGQANSEESGIYPFTYFASNSGGGYGGSWVEAMIAQYDYDTYNQLMTFTKKGENNEIVYLKENGYELYNSKAVLNALEVTYFLYDVVLASQGSTTQTLDQAQAAMMKTRGAVFMANGDWMLNEVKLNYKNNLDDIDFINFPVISAIGEEEFGAGTTLGLTEKEADKLLSYIVGLVDENKSIADIIASVKTNKNYDVTAKSVERIAKARGLNYNRGIEHQCFITKGSTKKDIAALFLRMLASDDCAETIARTANSTSAYASGVNEYSDKAFVVNASKIPVNKYATPYRWQSSGLRKMGTIGKLFPKSGDILPTIYLKTNTMFDKKGGLAADKTFTVYTDAAKAKQTEEYNFAKEQWKSWMDIAFPNK